MYANGEKWAQVQARGFMRDRKGKIMTPIISIRRGSITERDSLKKLDVKNIKISANSEKLNISQQISLKDMSFENIGNTKDSKDYKTVLKDTFDKAFKSVKNKVLSGNVGNTLDKIKDIDEEKIKEKIKKELYENKDKVKDKLKKLLKKN